MGRRRNQGISGAFSKPSPRLPGGRGATPVQQALLRTGRFSLSRHQSPPAPHFARRVPPLRGRTDLYLSHPPLRGRTVGFSPQGSTNYFTSAPSALSYAGATTDQSYWDVTSRSSGLGALRRARSMRSAASDGASNRVMAGSAPIAATRSG